MGPRNGSLHLGFGIAPTRHMAGQVARLIGTLFNHGCGGGGFFLASTPPYGITHRPRHSKEYQY
ncbi:hypothetical protein [Paenarthrobacter nicotinovorans]|uniref:hypothetical protein n=1 Tax=Paenarthrobacter nicotinovorans TaxID=29320 RepID=UPI0004BBB31D|nr:hypothetical protein [Paenarthrobacter nicotinovorans]